MASTNRPLEGEPSRIGPTRERQILSCAECRRSKLKCDRVFPCQSCIKRGCQALCPNGTLSATKGNKFLMAHAQRLSEQISNMTTRIEELESALEAKLNGTESPSKSNTPLIAPITQPVKPEWGEGIEDLSNAIGSLSLGPDGQAVYRGGTASVDYIHDFLPNDKRASSNLLIPDGSPEIAELVYAFPYGLKDCPHTNSLFVPYLPSSERALQLVDSYYQRVAWYTDPVIRSDFMEAIFNPIYESTGGDLESLHSHRLSVFFMILAIGGWPNRQPASPKDSPQLHHALGRAALSQKSLYQETSCAAVQSLFLMIMFSFVSNKEAFEERWLLSGICCRVAALIGLQRDSAGWNLHADEIQRRRQIFWELYNIEAYISFMNGRPIAISARHTDCRFPEDRDPFINSSGETELGWHAWKFRYAQTCLSAAGHYAFITRVQPYATLLELDQKIAGFPVPSHLDSPVDASDTSRAWSLNPFKAMQQYAVVVSSSIRLLLHRSYFTTALRERSDDPPQHKYWPSILASYNTALRLISRLRSVYAMHPEPFSRNWYFWTGVLSSCIALGTIVTESPGCELAEGALIEFRQALQFFETSSGLCRPHGTLEMLQSLYERAETTFMVYKAESNAAGYSPTSNEDESVEGFPASQTQQSRREASLSVMTSPIDSPQFMPTMNTVGAGSSHGHRLISPYDDSPSPPEQGYSSVSPTNAVRRSAQERERGHGPVAGGLPGNAWQHWQLPEPQ